MKPDLFRCRACSFKWQSQAYQCSNCVFTSVHILDFLTKRKIGYGESIPVRHHPDSCGCPGDRCQCLVCDEIYREADACRHVLEKVATGPTACPKCQHLYLDWLNYNTRT